MTNKNREAAAALLKEYAECAEHMAAIKAVLLDVLEGSAEAINAHGYVAKWNAPAEKSVFNATAFAKANPEIAAEWQRVSVSKSGVSIRKGA